jgi:small subunit ribosomal protein S6
MKRPYELTFVLRVDPNDQVMKDNVAKVQSWVEVDDTSKVNKIDTNHWGRRRLAYEIDGQREGYYVMMYADIDTDNLQELDRNLKLSPFILRHLLVHPH